MKTFDKKDVFTVVTTEEAKKHIGKEGYFGDDLRELKDAINNETYSILTGIYPRVLEEYDDLAFCENDSTYFRYFLPIDKVKEPEKEKKYRAFKDIREFADTLGIDNKFLVGASIKWRYKDRHSNQGVSLITNTFIQHENEIFITLGSQTYILDRLFTDLEWLDEDGNWKTFGVEE